MSRDPNVGRQDYADGWWKLVSTITFSQMYN